MIIDKGPGKRPFNFYSLALGRPYLVIDIAVLVDPVVILAEEEVETDSVDDAVDEL